MFSFVTASPARAFSRLRGASFAVRFGVSLVYSAVIAVLSLLPSAVIEKVPIHMIMLDKIVHAAMYALLALLVFPLWDERRALRSRAIGTIAFCSAYGLLMEILQYYFKASQRSFSLGDALANGIGAFLLTLYLVFSCRQLQPAPAAPSSAMRREP